MLSAIHPVRKKLHGPYIIVGRLSGRKSNTFRTAFRHHRTHLHILAEYRLDSGEQVLGISPLLSHTLLIQIEVKLLIIVFPPGKFRLDKHFLDATVRKQYLLHPDNWFLANRN